MKTINEEIYIDFDGVIVNTQDRIDYYFSMFDNTITPEWNKFLANINWRVDVLSQSKEINNSFKILKDLYELKANVYILSRVFSLNEYRDKLLYLRDNGIYINMIPSPERIEKSKVVIPNKKRILIDDSKANVQDWTYNGGQGILFIGNNSQVNNEFNPSVRDLSFLLKKK